MTRVSCWFATDAMSPFMRTAWASPAHLGTIGFAATVRIFRARSRREDELLLVRVRVRVRVRP